MSVANIKRMLTEMSPEDRKMIGLDRLMRKKTNKYAFAVHLGHELAEEVYRLHNAREKSLGRKVSVSSTVKYLIEVGMRESGRRSLQIATHVSHFDVPETTEE